MRRTLYWLLIGPLFFSVVFVLLRESCPVSWDGSGPMPGFYWGQRALLPSLAEYSRNPAYFDSEFRRPYLIAAAVITASVLPTVAFCLRRTAVRRRYIFVTSAAMSLVVLTLISCASDVGGALGWWFGPRILYPERLTVVLVMKLFSAIAVLTGIAMSGFDVAQEKKMPEVPPELT